MSRRHLPGHARAGVLERPVRVRRPAVVRRVEPPGRVAGVQVVVEARGPLRRGARVRLHEIPDPVSQNRSADRARHVVDTGQGRRLRQAGRTQFRRDVVRLKPSRADAGEEGHARVVSAASGDDVHDQAARFGLAQRAARGDGHLVHVPQVHHVARGRVAARGTADVEAVDEQPSLVGATPIDGEGRGHRSGDGVVRAGHHARDQREQRGVGPHRWKRPHRFAGNRQLTPGVSHIDGGVPPTHGHGVGRPADRELHVHDGRERTRDGHALPLDRIEP